MDRLADATRPQSTPAYRIAALSLDTIIIQSLAPLPKAVRVYGLVADLFVKEIKTI